VGHISNKDDDVKVSTYFYPGMVFPAYVELVSATLMYRNKEDKEDKVVNFSAAANGGATDPINRPEYKITHKASELATTVEFKPPFILDPHQPFYFYIQEKLEDSIVVLGYRNYNANFGNRLKTPLQK